MKIKGREVKVNNRINIMIQAVYFTILLVTV